MYVRQRKRMLWVVAIGLYAASALALAWGLLWPCGTGRDATNPAFQNGVQSRRTSNAPGRQPGVGVAQFEPLWGKRLAQPLSGTIPLEPQVSDESEQSSTLGLRLVGTVLEPGHSLALFMTAISKLELKGEGEVVGTGNSAAEVVRIERAHVVLRYQGDLITLRIHRANPQAGTVTGNTTNAGETRGVNSRVEDP